MTTLDERYADILTEQSDPQARRLVADLDDVCAAVAAPAQVRAAVAWAVVQRAAAGVPPARWPWRQVRPRWSWRHARARLVLVAAALVVALGGTLTYLQEAGPTPVSAQAQMVLRHAARAGRLAPNQAVHITYDDAVQDAGAAQESVMDVWLQADGQGHTERIAATQTIPRADGQVAVVNRWVLAGARGHHYVYDPHANTVALAPLSAQGLSADTGGVNIFDASSVAAYLTKVGQGAAGAALLLPQQTLDGVPVAVIQMNLGTQDHPRQLTVYVDAQSYLLRGLDVSVPHYSLQLRVRAYAAVAASAVPAGTFALDAPATARVVADVPQPTVGPSQSGVTDGSTSAAPDLHLPDAPTVLAGICHTTAAALWAAMQPGGKSPLAACRATDAALTQVNLVAAIAATLKASLAAAVAAGTITSADAAHRLAAIQAKLPAWVVTTP